MELRHHTAAVWTFKAKLYVITSCRIILRDIYQSWIEYSNPSSFLQLFLIFKLNWTPPDKIRKPWKNQYALTIDLTEIIQESLFEMVIRWIRINRITQLSWVLIDKRLEVLFTSWNTIFLKTCIFVSFCLERRIVIHILICFF